MARSYPCGFPVTPGEKDPDLKVIATMENRFQVMNCLCPGTSDAISPTGGRSPPAVAQFDGAPYQRSSCRRSGTATTGHRRGGLGVVDKGTRGDDKCTSHDSGRKTSTTAALATQHGRRPFAGHPLARLGRGNRQSKELE